MVAPAASFAHRGIPRLPSCLVCAMPAVLCCAALQSTVAKLLGARGVRSAFETVGIIIMLFTLSPLLATVLLVSAPLLTPVILSLTNKIGGASKAAQVGAAGSSSHAGYRQYGQGEGWGGEG